MYKSQTIDVIQSMPYEPLHHDDIYSEPHNIKNICAHYEISPWIEEDLSDLKNYDIHLIVDDSTSMQKLTYTCDSTGKRNTRWDELKSMVNIVVNIGGAITETGINIWFFNRQPNGDIKRMPFTNIKDVEYVDHLFREPPNGRTQLTDTLRQVIYIQNIKPKLILIATHGVSTNHDGYEDIRSFERLLKNRNADMNRICIILCTDDERIVEIYNNLDKHIERLNIIDEYQTEYKRVKNAQGEKFPYSYGTHMSRIMLSPIFQIYDNMDNIKIVFDKNDNPIKVTENNKKLCVIL